VTLSIGVRTGNTSDIKPIDMYNDHFEKGKLNHLSKTHSSNLKTETTVRIFPVLFARSECKHHVFFLLLNYQ